MGSWEVWTFWKEISQFRYNSLVTMQHIFSEFFRPISSIPPRNFFEFIFSLFPDFAERNHNKLITGLNFFLMVRGERRRRENIYDYIYTIKISFLKSVRWDFSHPVSLSASFSASSCVSVCVFVLLSLSLSLVSLSVFLWASVSLSSQYLWILVSVSLSLSLSSCLCITVFFFLSTSLLSLSVFWT